VTTLSQPVRSADVAAVTGLLRLAARLFAREVDQTLYQWLGEISHGTTGPRLIGRAETPQDEARALEELAVEYCRLFIGPQPTCPPYTSVHDGEVKLGARSATDIENVMTQFGVLPVISAQDAILEYDHLSVQLALLAHFYDAADVEGSAAELAWATAERLLEEHIWPWADPYLRHLTTVTDYALYRIIAELLLATLNEARTWPTRPPRTQPRE
jgi:TorA maturation chaperone TorD